MLGVSDNLFQNSPLLRPKSVSRIYFSIVVSVEVGDMGDEILLNTMFSVSTADTRFFHSSMESLHRLEMLTVDVGLAKLQFTRHLRGTQSLA